MSEEQKMTIAEKLKHFRHTNCLSQEKLAETSGISIRTIQRIEEGKSVGSGYTINALAKTLNINSTDLVNSVSQNTLPVSNNTSKLKILNFSAITMLVIPLANIFIPAYIYWKNRDDEKVKDIGSKIVSFQIFWTLATLLISIVVPALLLLLFSTLRTGSIPLFVPIYFISALLNIYFVIQFAININKQLPILQKVPNIL
jgi:XRE family transcriptional regulator, regulator of sulfur utilization